MESSFQAAGSTSVVLLRMRWKQVLRAAQTYMFASGCSVARVRRLRMPIPKEPRKL
jgi:hypothetical protein